VRDTGDMTSEPWEELSYTEQGMQGKDYVHMILGVW